MKNRTLTSSAVSAAALIMLAPLAAQADAKIEMTFHSNDITGLSAHDTDSTEYYQGDKKREEDLRKFTGAVMGALQRLKGDDKGSLDVDIYRVDQNKHFDLDTKKKTYSEQAIYDPSREAQESKGKGETQKQEPQEDKDVKVTKNEFTVKDTGKTKDINGFATHEYLVTWDYETENTKTGEKDKNLMTTDLWTSTDGKLAKAQAAAAAYSKAYLRLMKLPTDYEDAARYGFGSGHLEVNGKDMHAFFDKLRTIKGLPVSTDVTWESATTGAHGSNTNSGAEQAKSTQNLDNAIGSLFGKKSETVDQKPGTPGMTTIFSSHIEVKSVDTGDVDQALFEVPGDYKTD